MNIAYIIIVVAGVLGLALSLNIFVTKRKKKVLVCPLKSDCNAVVNSDFSELFGIPLEIMGIAYYLIIVSSYGLFLGAENFKTEGLAILLLMATTGACLFSIYLILVQLLAIKQWCVWCLTSAFLSFVIFVTTVTTTTFSLFEILINYQEFIITGLTIGLILGVGASLIYNILFIKFLKDFKISELEEDTLKTISQIVWLAIITIIISGVGLYLSQPDIYNESAAFLVKIFVLGAVILAEVLLNIILAPQLLEIKGANVKKEKVADENPHMLRKLSFATSLSALVSWFALLTFILLPLGTSIPLLNLMFYYIIALICAITISQYIDFRLGRK